MLDLIFMDERGLVWVLRTPHTNSLPLSQRCRILAQECRAQARSFRNEEPHIQMFDLAADYERKAQQAEAIEASLRLPRLDI